MYEAPVSVINRDIRRGSRGGGFGGRDPPLLSTTNFFFQQTFKLHVDGVTRAMSKGGVLVNVLEWGYFQFFLRADDVTRTRSKGGVLVNVLEWGYFSIFFEGG